MQSAARMSSKGQVTVPKAVPDALGVKGGDALLFRVEGNRAVIPKTADFLDLACTIAVPPSKKNATWNEVLRRSRHARAASIAL